MAKRQFRVEKTHSLWSEIREGYGFDNRMIADCVPDNLSPLFAAAPDMYDALQKANLFIRNGIELGYIVMPDKNCLDPAHNVPEIIQKALAKTEGSKQG